MSNYIRPQVQVFQEFRQLPADVTANLNAFVFGPNYRLFRYAVAAEKELIGLGAYNPDADTVFGYPNQPSGSAVDTGYVKLFMENAWAQYAAIPAALATPLVPVSTVARNKLRAAPRIQDAEELKDGSVTLTNGVELDAGGYVYNSPALPEIFYFTPTGGTLGDFMSRLAARTGAWDAEDVSLFYTTTTERQRGTVDIPASAHPLTAGVTVAGPFGFRFNLSPGARSAGYIDYAGQPNAAQAVTIVSNAGSSTVITFNTDVAIGATARETYDNLKHFIHAAGIADITECVHVYGATAASGRIYIIGNGGNDEYEGLSGTLANATVADVEAFSTLRQPTVLLFSNADASAGFTLSVDPDALPGVIDRSIDNGLPLKVKVVAGSGGGITVDWSDATQTLTVEFDVGATTLGDLYDALSGDADVAALFALSEFDDDDDAETVDLVTDETESPVTNDWPVVMIRDGYRVKVYPNDVTFATGNGFSNSAHFKSRGVRVGDRLRYSAVGPDSETYTGTTQVVGIESDTLAARVDPATVDADNAATAAADELLPHTGLTSVVIPGDDNQRSFDGARTALFALDPLVNAYPGDYSAGVVDETFTVTVTASGAAGTARASIATASGAYSRTNAMILPIHWDDIDADNMAMLYLGNNLWVVFQKGTSDADALFQAGDTYTFSRPVVAPWRAIPAAKVTASGTYAGARDTTYKVEVVRGGVFTPGVTAIDGMLNPNRATLVYTGLPTDGDTLTIGGVTFEFDDNDSTLAGNVAVDIVALDPDGTYGNLVDAINAQAEHLYAELAASSDTLYIRGPFDKIDGATALIDNATLEVATAQLSPVLSLDDWGDADDEYILRCTQGGTLPNAQFSLESLTGDNVSAIAFSGSGSAAQEELGANGLKAYFTTSSADVAFAAGDFWVVRVNGTRPRVRITDTAGVDQSSYAVVDSATEFSLGLYGVKLTFDANTNNEGGFVSGGGLLTGDTFYVACSAAAAGPNQVLVLADDLPAAATPGLTVDVSGAVPVYTPNYDPTEFSVWLYLVQASAQIESKKVQSPPDRNWTAAADGVTVHADIAVQDATWVELDGSLPYLPVYAADLLVEYRALLADYSDAIYSLSGIGDVATELGTVHPDNPLAQGVYNALANSGAQPVYFMAVPSDDLAGYSAVLIQAEKTSAVYGLSPLTRDLQILAAVEGHINTMSGESEKKWRIGFVGTELPAKLGAYTSETNGNAAWLATVIDNPGAGGEQYTLLECTNGAPKFLTEVKPGDEVRINFATDFWGEQVYESYTVASVQSNRRLLLATGPDAAINVATKFEVWHTRSTAEIATAVAARSNYFGSRRMYHVFPDVGYMNGVAQTAEFLAAAVAGLCSSVVPQRGLTNTEVNGFDNLPSVYRTYSAAQLDEMADKGTLILMQDSAGNQVYVRHQVSTAAGDNNILTTELSVTKNLDAISYYFANALAPYIGRYNITPELLTVLRTQVQDGLNFMGSDLTGAGLVGPMLVLGDGTAIRRLEQHPTLQDHIVIIVDVQLPLPVNVIQLHLVV